MSGPQRTQRKHAPARRRNDGNMNQAAWHGNIAGGIDGVSGYGYIAAEIRKSPTVYAVPIC
eukprot:2008372-Pleurochrysis_carterae.AAC.1